MKLRSILAGTALAALALAAAPQLGAPQVIRPAEAAVNVSIGIFYDRLGEYGDWVSYRDQYVFIPGHVDVDWRPYTLGHWVHTKRYGWTWVSEEPFGWATYHYGRWGYAEDIGWYWVPGNRWAPAWVSWRRNKNYVVWAPLPPSRHGGVDVSININVGDIPDYYWVAVPTRRFLAPDLRVAIVHDDSEIRQVVRETKFIGTPQVTNNIVVNNVIDVNVIARETGEKVPTVEVRTTDNPADAKSSADQVTAFQGEIAPAPDMKPKKLSDVSKVKKVKRNQAGDTTAPDANATAPADNTGTAPAETTTTTPATPPASNEAATPPASGKDKKKVDTGSNATAPADASGEANAPAATGAQPAPQAQDQPADKKKKKKQNENAAAPATGSGQPAQAEDQSSSKKKKKQQGSEDATGSTTAAPSQGGTATDSGTSAPDQNTNAPADQKKKGKGKKDQACDPATDANCAAAQ